MKNPLIAVSLASAFLFSCSDFKAIERMSLEDWLAMEASSSSGEQEIGSISGVSQKGPFRKGASVVLSELDNNLVQSGRTFQAQIEDDDGSFEIKGIKLVSPYVLISVDGFYLNEVTGLNSGTKIALYAVSDVTSKSSVNVNLMSHLEFHRVQSLADKGKDIAAAKKQAQKEILAVFGISGDNFKDSEDMSIFGMSESDAALLAISVLLQNKLSEADFSVLLADFSQRLKASGVWDNEAKKAEIAAWASGADLGAIRSNIVGWGISSNVPDFEKHVRGFYELYFPPGGSSSSEAGGSSSSSALRSCTVGFNQANRFCYDGVVYDKCDGLDYIPVSQYCDRERGFVITAECDGAAFNPLFQKCENKIILTSCGSDWYNETTQFCLGPFIPPNFTDYYIYDKCGGTKTYNPNEQFCHTESGNIGDRCAYWGPYYGWSYYYDPDLYKCKPEIHPTAVFLKNPVSHGGEDYEAVLIGEQVWLARNLNYNVSGSLCYGDNTGGDSQNSCSAYGRLYDWATALDIDVACNTATLANCGATLNTPHKGICPAGWHIPSDAEWDVLTAAVGGTGSGNRTGAATPLKATSGWNASGIYVAGTDSYGFSALPGGYYDYWEASPWWDVGDVGCWWSSTETSNNRARTQEMECSSSNVFRRNGNKVLLSSIRCVRD